MVEHPAPTLNPDVTLHGQYALLADDADDGHWTTRIRRRPCRACRGKFSGRPRSRRR
jgi:hypothetical protein